MKSSIILWVLLLGGCSSDFSLDAPTNYSCTAEQWQKARLEAVDSIKLDNVRTTERYWLGTAIQRNCTWRNK